MDWRIPVCISISIGFEQVSQIEECIDWKGQFHVYEQIEDGWDECVGECDNWSDLFLVRFIGDEEFSHSRQVMPRPAFSAVHHLRSKRLRAYF